MCIRDRAGSDVTLLTSDEDFLPGFDSHLLQFVWKSLRKSGVEIIEQPVIKGYQDGMLLVNEDKINCDALVNASWRHAIIPKSTVAFDLTKRGYVHTDMEFETSVPGIFAIGDVNGKSYLAHVGSAQGIWLINHFKGIRNTFKLGNYPYNLYTTPEIAQIGKTEQQLQSEGIPFKVNEFPLSANGKALAEGNAEGFIRMLSEERYGQVMGVQIIANHATDMIAEAAAFMSIEGTVYDVAQTIHAHPTVSEIFMEAGFDAVDQAIHK
jgi:dihydrolipoamide dehydrogenase